MSAERLLEHMEEVESEQEYDGYYYSLGEALTIVVLGNLCGLKNVSQIHQWAESEKHSIFPAFCQGWRRASAQPSLFNNFCKSEAECDRIETAQEEEYGQEKKGRAE